MRKLFFFFLLSLVLLSGCLGKSDDPVITRSSVTFPDADIVFNAIGGNFQDLLGFYSIADQNVELIDFGWNTIIPYYIAPKTIFVINKKGYPGDYLDRDGNLMVFGDNRKVRCGTKETYGQFFRPHKDIILFSSMYGINMINPFDCEIVETLLTNNSADDYTDFFNSPVDLSSDNTFLVLNSGTNLINLNLITKEIWNYEIEGTYPSISPNQEKIAFLGKEGIFVMNTDGSSPELIVPYVSKEEGSNYYRGNPPKPNWSLDNTRIVFHKCNQPLDRSCSEIIDYDIYIYDFESKTENLIIHGGLNPSWNYFKQEYP